MRRVEELEQLLAEQQNLLAYEEGRSNFLAALRRVLKLGGLVVAVAVARAALNDLARTDADRRRWYAEASDGYERGRAREDMDLAAHVRRLLRDFTQSLEEDQASQLRDLQVRERRLVKAIMVLRTRPPAEGARLALGLLDAPGHRGES